jgi:membrane-associated phospholipid phosphatase
MEQTVNLGSLPAATDAVRFAQRSPSRAHFRPLRRAVPALWTRRRDPHLYVQVSLAAIFLAALWGFGLVVEDYLTGDPLVRWDVEFSRWLHEHSSSFLVSAFKVVTLAGNVAGLAVVIVAASLYLLRRAQLDRAAFLCAGALGIEILNPILKLAFHRPRPELAYVHLDTYSFPSGHAAGSAAIYALVFYLLAKSLLPRWKLAAAAAYVVLVLIVGFSRLYLEVHYLSDVLAGVSLGIAWASVCLFLYEWRGDLVSRVLPSRLRVLAERLALPSTSRS